ncbi:hypothetical protein, partial [Lentilactobacillus parabuchneri]|uniref:hypothetical protein n=1 Tax=Lentilactobacillus parabuchneri TaxID=152331 RepID=UPI001958FB46
PKLLQIPSKSAVRFSSSYKKSSNHQVIRTPIFCSPTTVDEEPFNRPAFKDYLYKSSKFEVLLSLA